MRKRPEKEIFSLFSHVASECKLTYSPYSQRDSFKRFPPISTAKYYFNSDTSLIEDLLTSPKSRFLEELQKNNIPSSIQTLYDSIISSLSISSASIFMNSEIKSLQINKSLVQRCLESLKKWDKNLDLLHEFVSHTRTDYKWMHDQSFLKDILKSLTDHLYLSISLVSNILLWEKTLKSYTLMFPGKIEFTVDGRNILEEFETSCDFIKDSELSSLFSLAYNDPFLLEITRKLSAKRKNYSITSPRSHSYLIRPDSILYLFAPKDTIHLAKQLLLNLNARKEVKDAVFRVTRKLKNVSTGKKNRVIIKMKSPRKDRNRSSMRNENIDEVTKAIHNKLLNSYLRKEIQLMVQTTVDEIKMQEEQIAARNAGNILVSQEILENFIDIVIEEYKFKKLSETTYWREEKKIKQLKIQENIIIIQDLLDNIIEDELEASNLSSICLDMYQESLELQFQEIQAAAAIEVKRREENMQAIEQITTDYIHLELDSFDFLELCKQVYEKMILIKQQEEFDQRSSMKSKKLQEFSLIENILRNLIEIEISNISDICEEIFLLELSSKVQTLEKTNNDIKNSDEIVKYSSLINTYHDEKFLGLIYQEILEEFINLPWLEDLVQTVQRRPTVINISNQLLNTINSIQNLEDFAMEVFTPGVHSPNEVSFQKIEETLEEDSPNLNNPLQVYNFSTDSLIISSPHLQQVLVKYSNIESALSEYFKLLPIEFQQIYNKSEDPNTYCNPKYYWILENSSICGLLIYSEDTLGYTIRHISCLNFSSFTELLKLLPILLPNTSSSNLTIKFPLFSPEDLPPPLHETLLSLNFTLTPSTNVEYRQDSQNLIEKFPVKIYTSSIIHLESEKVQVKTTKKVCKEMTEIGSRHCLLSNILRITEGAENIEESSAVIRLQQDLAELLDILIRSDFSPYSLFQTYPDIPVSELPGLINRSITDLSLEDKCQVSKLVLDLFIPQCNFVTYDIEGTSYKYLMVPAGKCRVRLGNEGFRLFLIPTNQENIKIFVLQYPDVAMEVQREAKAFGTDLFHNVSEMIKTFDDFEEGQEALWVPCFRKEVFFTVPWAQGFQIIREGDSENFVCIKKCFEDMAVQLEYTGKANNTLDFFSKSDIVITDTFVFGIYYEPITEMLELPLLISMVNRDEWITYNML